MARPAFADATVELTDEMTASIFNRTEPLECVVDTFDVHLDLKIPELTAASPTPSRGTTSTSPNPRSRTRSSSTRNGRVYGHLAVWGEPHRGYVDQLRTAPRPHTAYMRVQPFRPPDRERPGRDGTDLRHRRAPARRPCGARPTDQIHDAYGGIENAWADVRVSEGVHGPWMSGRVRPGVSDEVIYAARASHISGHWLGEELVAIVSCNVPGFKPGAGFASVSGGEILELVASFPGIETVETIDLGEQELVVTAETNVDDLATAIADALERVLTTRAETAAVDTVVTDDARRRLAMELALDDD